MMEAKPGATTAGAPSRIYVIRTGSGEKRAVPPVAIAQAKSADVPFEMVCLAPGWEITAITCDHPRITYDAKTRLMTVPQGTDPGYYEYEITLSNLANRTLTECVQGNSSPGVLVDP